MTENRIAGSASRWCIGFVGLLGAGLFWASCVESGPAEPEELADVTSAIHAGNSSHDRGHPHSYVPRFHGRNPHPICHGKGGAGGHAGAGGMTGAGGAPPPPPPMACQGTPPASALITDFSDATGSDPITFGTAPNIMGGTFAYSGTGLTPPALSIDTSGSGINGLRVVANPGATADGANNFFGFGLFLDSCIDATAYTGVQFTITGNLGNCGINFATNFSETTSPSDDTRGSCTLASCFPGSTPVTSTGTVVIPFASASGGSPPVIDPRSIIGIQWQMGQALGAACSADFVISDVTFTTAQPPPPPPPPPPACPVFVAATPALTGNPATPAAPQAVYTFQATGLSPPAVTPLFGSDLTWQGLDVTLNPGATTDSANAFVGFGVPLFGCVDARAFSGVRFTINGDLGTCPLQFGIVPQDDNSTMFGGSCAASVCLEPTSNVLSSGTNVLPFTALSGGTPDPTLNPSALMDIQWQLNVPTDGVTPACNAHFTITDIAFVP